MTELHKVRTTCNSSKYREEERPKQKADEKKQLELKERITRERLIYEREKKENFSHEL